MRAGRDEAPSFDGKVLSSVLKALNENSSRDTDSSTFRSFVEKFYDFSYSTDVELSGEFLLNMVRSLYEFIGNRKSGQAMVRVFTVARPESKGAGDFTIIQTANDNLPFIVDSIIIAIKQHCLSIHHYTNTVLSIERVDGRIVNINPRHEESRADDATSESVAYFVVGPTNESNRKKLKEDIEGVLGCVACCVHDWQPMVDRASRILSDLDGDENFEEICSFLQWLCKDNFVFLGYGNYVRSPQGNVLTAVEEDSLGLMKIEDYAAQNCRSVDDGVAGHLYIAQSNVISPVHRHGYTTCVTFRTFDAGGKVVREEHFYGFFTSHVSFQSAQHIPIVRQKVEYVEKKSGFIKNGHNIKALVAIAQKFSREELFYFSEEELFQISMGILSLSSAPKVKLFMLKDAINGFITCIIFIPKDLANTELANRVARVLEGALSGNVVGHHYNMYNESDLVKLQFTLKVEHIAKCGISERDVEKLVVESTRRWEDKLLQVLHKKNMYEKFCACVTAFPVSYQEYFTPEGACHDILKIDEVLRSGTWEVDLFVSDKSSQYQLKIYVPLESDLHLSKVLDIVRNMGVKVAFHYSYDVNILNKCIRLHHFILFQSNTSPDYSIAKSQFEIVLKKVFCKQTESDYFNSLVLLANLRWKEVLLIRALSRYLKQISFSYSQSYVQKVVRKHHKVIALLVALFEAKFDPKISVDRKGLISSICKDIEESFACISDIVHDYVLRCMYGVILSTVRTNYYQDPDKSYISIKLDPSGIADIPLPCPFREIYVYSNVFEGIHLRGGKVARGGLRWSDRTEDFRTEILGLMKAQMTKNSVIVPVGSKGGFIVRGGTSQQGGKPTDFAVECYKNFLRGILDVTDNIVDGKCVPPVDVVRYDDDDPYLVVAADKGTAAFSDHANKVSEEYGFWLGDAFASGGSVGFDHKKIGITAKGAWVAACRHFWVMGRNIEQLPFTAIGIGDMSGDVFGNGMLLSKKMRLLGAFNHLHIFIDPSPDIEKSYAERQRLFNTPGSSWMDYNPELISKGGGVFCRQVKSIELTEEMRQCFAIETSRTSVSPTELIQMMLQAPVDMIWNGGIGTYVKSSTEENSAVRDKANDLLRVDGKSLRASMVVEGGNLGCTQLGRIEYSSAGGMINTDFMDNSGGVICSDFEVNLKICLEMAVKDGFISMSERNKILDDMLYDIPNIILESHNKLETRALMLETMQAQKRVEQHHRIMLYLEKVIALDRSIEFLPSDDEIQTMLSESRGLSAPQIAVLIAYVRTFTKNAILNSSFLFDQGLSEVYEDKYLLSYFPECIRNRFEKYIRQHKLKHEILATCIANDIVNRMGCVFVSHTESMGIAMDMIARVYIITTCIYNLDDIWSELDRIDGKIDVHDYVKIVREVQKFIGQATFWFFRHMHKFAHIEKRIGIISTQILSLEENLSNILSGEFLDAYNEVFRSMPRDCINPDILRRIGSLRFSIFGMDIVYISESSGMETSTVGMIFFRLWSVLNFGRVRDLAMQMDAVSSYWQRIAIRNLLDDLSDYQSIITGNIVQRIMSEYPAQTNVPKNIAESSVSSWCAQHKSRLDAYYRFLEDIDSSQLDLSKLVLIIRSLSVFTVEKDCNA